MQWTRVWAIGLVVSAAAWAGFSRQAARADRAGAAAEPAPVVPARDEAPKAMPPGFDPARYMRVAEVKPGMTGYGLSVFSGSTIERFDVKVISILKNFNPKYDVVLVSCSGQNLEHTGGIAGMSGSPVYLKDEQGRERMIGAFAYGWPLAKDPVGGVQPIEYMLGIPDNPTPQPADVASAPVKGASGVTRGRVRWSIGDVTFPGMTHQRGMPMTTGWSPAKHDIPGTEARVSGSRLTGEEVTRLQPLATPLMAGGMSSKMMEAFAPMFASCGVSLMQAGGASSSAPLRGEAPGGAAAAIDLAPGSVLGVPLLLGDADMTAIGTCTDVIGDRVLGFGHSFNNEGAVALPMGGGTINTVIASLTTSFKIGSLSRVSGTLLDDTTVGVAGRLGPPPKTAPIDLALTYADGSLDQHYHFEMALHPKFTPLIAAAAMGIVMTDGNDLPLYNTLDYDVTLAFENGQELHLVNRVVDTNPNELFGEIGLPIVAAGDNPYGHVAVKSIRGSMRVARTANHAEIVSVSVPRESYRPGESARIFVNYRPFRGAEATLALDFDLPGDLPDGTYPLAVNDWQNYIQSEMATRPFRFSAESTADIFAVLKDVMALKHNALYVQLFRKPDGVAVGRTALAHLPSSRRKIFQDAGISDITPFVSSSLKVVPTDAVMEGSAQFNIVIDREGRRDATPRLGEPSHPVEPHRGGPRPLTPAAPAVPAPAPPPPPG